MRRNIDFDPGMKNNMTNGTQATWLATLIALATMAAPAQAQAQIDTLLKNAARQIANASAADTAASADSTTVRTAAAKPHCTRSRATPLPPLGPRPGDYQPETLWPDDTGCDAYAFADLKFEAARARKKAFEDASKVRCNDCEGGHAIDAWAHFHVVKGGNAQKQFAEMLLALQPGQNIAWKGKRYAGTVQATGAHAIGPFPCRQFHWTLKDGSQVVAERDGLFCEYKRPYAGSASWNEVL